MKKKLYVALFSLLFLVTTFTIAILIDIAFLWKTDNQLIQDFKYNYFEARSSFMHSVENSSQKFLLNTGKIKVEEKEKNNDALYIDWAHFTRKNQSPDSKQKLVIIISGVHGIEGVAGNAVQKQVLSRLDTFPENLDFLFVHAVNPWGYFNNRRYTENNVDLNRNFLNSFETTPNSKAYEIIHKELALGDSAQPSNFYDFINKVLSLKSNYGEEVVRGGVMTGQYQYPTGLQFGGNTWEQNSKELMTLVKKVGEPYKSILMLDLHTGYGDFAKLHFLSYDLQGVEKEQLKQVFNGFKIVWPRNEGFYQVKGGVLPGLRKLFPDKVTPAMVFEYGTVPLSESILGKKMGRLFSGITSLYFMAYENQCYFSQSVKTKQACKQEAFNKTISLYAPKDAFWQQQVLTQSESAFKKVLQNFSRFCVEGMDCLRADNDGQESL